MRKERGEGDLNSRGRKTKGLAILRRCQAGPSPLGREDIKRVDKKFMSRQILKYGSILIFNGWKTGQINTDQKALVKYAETSVLSLPLETGHICGTKETYQKTEQ